MEPFATLPPSCAVYCGFHGNQRAISSFFTECLKACGEGGDPGFTAAHAEIRRGYEQLNYGTLVAAFPVWPVDRGLLRMISITEVNDPQRARELGLKWMELPPLPGIPDTRNVNKTLGVEKFAGHPVDVIASASSIILNPLPIQGQDFDKLLFGLDGHVTRTIYLKDRIVEATGGTRLEMAATVRLTEAVAADGIKPDHQPLFLKTRKKLGEKSNVVVLVDVNGIVAGLLRAEFPVAGQMALNAQPAAGVAEQNQQVDDAEKAPEAAEPTMNDQKIESQIESLKSTASLLGISLTLEPQAARLSLVFPMKSIQGLLSAAGGNDPVEIEKPDEEAMMEGNEEATESEADEMAAEADKPVEVPEEKIVGDRTWNGKILERKTLKPVAGAEVTVKFSTTGDETTTETKTLREIVLKTGEDGTYEFTVKKRKKLLDGRALFL